jgi:chromosome segregation ATPase
MDDVTRWRNGQDTDAEALHVAAEEVQQLRKELAELTEVRAILRQDVDDLHEQSTERLHRAEQAEAERDELRDTLDATMRNFEDYVEQLRDAEAERDALKAAANHTLELLDELEGGSGIAADLGLLTSPDLAVVRHVTGAIRVALDTPTPTEEADR